MADEDHEPFETGSLDVGNGHVLYWEQYGAEHGVPVVYLHGGPGSGCTPGIRRAFNPAVHRAVLFDQRASGRSTPHASQDGVDWPSIDMNHHVADVEALRTHLDIDQWIVSGVSWGSILGATYAERHADRVLGMVLGAVSLDAPKTSTGSRWTSAASSRRSGASSAIMFRSASATSGWSTPTTPS